MVETIEGQWFDSAIGEDPVLLQPKEYVAEIESHDEEHSMKTVCDNISYNPEGGEAIGLSMDVPAHDDLEGTTYLGGEVTVYLNDETFFVGELEEPTASPQDSEYSLDIIPYAQQMSGDDVDEYANNETIYDVINRIIDEFGEVINRHNNVAGTSNEQLSGIVSHGQGVRAPENTEGTATYTEVGQDASEIEALYVKIFSPDAATITVESDTNAFSEDISGRDTSMYGTWVELYPEDLDGQFDIKFNLEGDSRLINWRVLTDVTVKRESLPPEVETTLEDAFIYELTGDNIEQDDTPLGDEDDNGDDDAEIYNVETDELMVVDDGYIRPRQMALWLQDDVANYTDELASGGGAYDIETGDDITNLISVFTDIEDPIEDYYIWVRGRLTDVEDGDDDHNLGVAFDAGFDEHLHFNDVGWFTEDEYTWVEAFNSQFSNIPDTIDDDIDYINFFQEDDGDSECTVLIDAAVIVHRPDDYNYTFSDELVNDYLNRPYIWATPEHVDGEINYAEIDPYVAEQNITESTTTFDIENMDDPAGNWGVQQSITDGDDYPGTITELDEITDNYSYPGISHNVRMSLCASGERDDEHPRLGYQPMEYHGHEVTADHNDLSVLFDYELADNRLSVINSITNDTDATFRVEGDTLVVMQAGSIKIDPDIKIERVESTPSIEEVYSRCRVTGVDGADSGWIEAPDAPDFIDKEKRLRQQDIETDEDAILRARSFLQNNGSIKYKGTLETPPTLAPIGYMMDGDIFPHGHDMIIEEVSYSSQGTTIELGYRRNISQQFVGIESSLQINDRRGTGI